MEEKKLDINNHNPVFCTDFGIPLIFMFWQNQPTQKRSGSAKANTRQVEAAEMQKANAVKQEVTQTQWGLSNLQDSTAVCKL